MDNRVIVNFLDYDIASMKYVLSSETCGLPSSGFVRDYPVATVDPTGRYFIAGTAVSDFCVFSVAGEQGYLFRHNQSASGKGGITALCYCGGLLFVGCGDGSLAKYRGEDKRWAEEDVWEMKGAVVSLSASADQREVLVGTTLGNVYRVAADTADCRLVASSHVSPVVDVSFGAGSELFSTVAQNGNLRAWDLSDYRVVMETQVTQSADTVPGRQPTIVNICTSTSEVERDVLTGWKDGFVRCHSLGGELLWAFQAHQNAVSAITETAKFIATAGEDGSVRIWARKSRELLLQFWEHRKAVTQLLVDVRQDHMIHSCGLDRAVLTYNIKREQRTVIHQVHTGAGRWWWW